MSDEPQNPTSPTGTPVLTPTTIPAWLIVGVTLAAGFTAAGQMLPEEYRLARVICSVLGIALGAGLGIASPGLRKVGTTLALLLCVGLMSTGCATSYRPKVTGPEPFSFVLTPEQCTQLKQERRTYHGIHEAAGWTVLSGPLLGALFAAIPALRDEHALQGATAGVALAGGIVERFTQTQMDDIDPELSEGGCSR
jgi:hypothetical protein